MPKIHLFKSGTHYIESGTASWFLLIHYDNKVATAISEQFQESDLNDQQLEVYKKLKKSRPEIAENKNTAPLLICHNLESMNV